MIKTVMLHIYRISEDIYIVVKLSTHMFIVYSVVYFECTYLKD